MLLTLQSAAQELRTMGPGIRLVTRGDDAGSCVSANRAIVDAFERGILRNCSIMVPGPAFEDAAEQLRDLDGLCLGLHVTLNAEWDSVKWGPVLPPAIVPSLVASAGSFHQNPRLTHQADPKLEEMVNEVEAQLANAREHGLRIAYLDEHMGVGWINGLEAELRRICRGDGLVFAGDLKYLRWGQEGGSPAERMLAAIRAADPGTYVVVTHPGYDAEDMRAFIHPGLAPGQIARERDADRRLWSDPLLLDGVQAGVFTPVTYVQAVA